jgi:chitinase
MKQRVGTLALAAAVALVVAAAAAAKPPVAPAHVRGAFFTNWSRYARGYTVKQIPADKLNVIDYAFAFPAADGTCVSSDPWSDFQAPTWSGSDSVDGVADDPSNPDQHLFGNFNQLRKLKAAHPNLRLEISIGGWTGSVYFSDVAATAASRQKFVQSCIDLFIKGNLPTGGWPTQAGGVGAAAGLFDGINIDWEYPGVDPGNGAHHTAADRANATLLLQEFRRQLDDLAAANGRQYLLTDDIPGGNVHSSGSWDLKAVSKTVDWIDLMALDFHGGWEPWTDFNSPLLRDPSAPPIGGDAIPSTWSTAGSVAYFLANGVPAHKLSLGIPFYGKEYVGVGPAGNGLYQPHGPQPGNDSPTYHDLVDTGLADANLVPIGPTAANADGSGTNGFTRYYSFAAGAPWLYNPVLNGGTFISYVDPAAVAARVALVDGFDLRGAWAWEISNDSNAHDLTNALSSGSPDDK